MLKIPNAYRDSVELMQVSAELKSQDGVEDCAVVMGTPANVQLLLDAGFISDDSDIKPNDLLICVKSQDADLTEKVLQQAKKRVFSGGSSGGSNNGGAQEGPSAPTTLLQAVQAAEQADPEGQSAPNLALISVPGEYATAEVLKALNLGMSVFCFSDNVPVQDEVDLKKIAHDRGQLVMGPDCGTAILQGVPLGFANKVRDGSIGVVAASGTGLQQVTSLIHQLGYGVAQAVGVGGRDLSVEIGGISMLTALDAMQADPKVEVVVILSKPPDHEVAEKILSRARRLGKPTVVNFLGGDINHSGKNANNQPQDVFMTDTLEAAAIASVSILSKQSPAAIAEQYFGHKSSSSSSSSSHDSFYCTPDELRQSLSRLDSNQNKILGLYSGGTLCKEASVVLKHSSKYHPGSQGYQSEVVDLGDDQYTVGRPHPMIDFDLRSEWLLRVSHQPEVAVVLLDLVLGYGAHEDPAQALAPALRKLRESLARQGRHVAIVASICGTDSDPQPWAREAQTLKDAGVLLAPTNTRAALLAHALASRQSSEATWRSELVEYPDSPLVFRPSGPPGSPGRVAAAASHVPGLHGGVRAVNLGLPRFVPPIVAVGAQGTQLKWQPPAAGDRSLGLWLGLMEGQGDWGKRIEAANKKAIESILTAHPVLEDCTLAYQAIPGFFDSQTNKINKILLHAGPPVTWEAMCGPMKGAMIGACLFEGWANSAQDAERLLTSGAVSWHPNHHYGSVGPMAGVLSPTMPVWVVRDANHPERKTYSNLNEGLGKVLRFGANSDEVLERLHWMKNTLAPGIQLALQHYRQATGQAIDLRALTSQALQMGDECHNRNAAATSLFTRLIAPHLVAAQRLNGGSASSASGRTPTLGLGSGAEGILEFLGRNDHFFLNLSMASCKLMLDAGHNVQDSSIVTAMARNGVEFGVRVSGTGDQWFTAPAPQVSGLFLPGFGPADAAPDLGDSAITETVGIGGFAMAAAPAIVRFVGGNAQTARLATQEMGGITLAKNANYALPAMDFQGTPTGIDIRRVVETGVLPVINTGIAHKAPGVGQVGAGVTRAPMACFQQALVALGAQLRYTSAAHNLPLLARNLVAAIKK